MKQFLVFFAFILNFNSTLAFAKSTQSSVTKQEIHNMGKFLKGRENSSNRTRAVFALGCYLDYSNKRNKRLSKPSRGRLDR